MSYRISPLVSDIVLHERKIDDCQSTYTNISQHLIRLAPLPSTIHPFYRRRNTARQPKYQHDGHDDEARSPWTHPARSRPQQSCQLRFHSFWRRFFGRWCSTESADDTGTGNEQLHAHNSSFKTCEESVTQGKGFCLHQCRDRAIAGCRSDTNNDQQNESEQLRAKVSSFEDGQESFAQEEGCCFCLHWC